MRPAVFDFCMNDARTAETVNRDSAAAAELNIASTPFFFINGRPLRGNQPADQFEAVIADELRHRQEATRTQAAR
jgi:protein-disulfide isomerase